MACVLAGLFPAGPSSAAEFPFSLRRERPELENPFQRRPQIESSSVTHAGGTGAGTPGDVRLASLEGAWIDPPPIQTPEGTADFVISPQMEYGPDIVFQSCEEPWCWQLLAPGLVYRSYMAGPREPRLGMAIFREGGSGDWLWDGTLGGRISLLRYGTTNPLHPDGFEIQVEGASLVRLNMEQNRDVESSDFRAGVPVVYGIGKWQFKSGYYHLSSHLGDEYIIRVPDAERINYVRDAILLAVSYYPDPSLRLYAETSYAFYTSGGADPWEFQFGFEYAEPGITGCAGTPFVAANGHLRQEIDYSGDFALQAGWLWRGPTGATLRTGLHFLTGKSPQYQFYDTSEEQIGLGLWYDF